MPALAAAHVSKENPMTTDVISRRNFLATAAGTAALGLTATRARAVNGANERIRIGIIGCGNRASSLVNEIKEQAPKQNVTIVACCDVWKVNLNKMAAWVKENFGEQPYTCTRFGDLLKRDDVAAVVIATPDFAHTPIMIAALQWNKDVYCEKPMSMEIAKANKALDLARERKRVVQVGTQRRSSGQFKGAAKCYATGVLGQVSRVEAAMNVNQPRWRRDYEDCKEQDVDWDAYLFNREMRPFDAKLLRRWQLYRMCTNGISGLWMAHYSDALHMITGATYPRNAVTNGGTYVWKDDGREIEDTFHTVMEYPEGFLWDWGMGLGNGAGVRFFLRGRNGSMDADRFVITGDGGVGDKKIEGEQPIESVGSESHMGNWLECLRTRKRPNADIQFGHQHAVATIMAAAALHTGQRQIYDPVKREIHPG
jgi:predicted dehydrogenase